MPIWSHAGGRQKIGGPTPLPADADALLRQLAQFDPRAAEILQLTYFGGLGREDIAAVLGLSVPTIDRELRFSRAWLAARLQRDLQA